MTALGTMIVASRAEEGCLHDAYARDLIDPQVMVILEHWRDRTALDFHFATPHMVDFRAALAKSGAVVSMNVRMYQTDEGSPL